MVCVCIAPRSGGWAFSSGGDQRIRGASLVCLPELDHAQVVFGGHSFDAGRFWQTLVQVTLQ